ncbi:MAG: hypothetical protein Kow0098_20150 [Ignavibacteriaceae bacterium]
MKFSVLILSLSILFFSGCKEKEKEFEAFSAEAFAYDLGDLWEVNASARVRGFKQLEEEDVFIASLKFQVDLKMPDGKIVEGVYSDSFKVSQNEVLTDFPLEAQFTLDTTYSTGKYEIIFNVSDGLSGKKTKITADFLLEE